MWTNTQWQCRGTYRHFAVSIITGQYSDTKMGLNNYKNGPKKLSYLNSQDGPELPGRHVEPRFTRETSLLWAILLEVELFFGYHYKNSWSL